MSYLPLVAMSALFTAIVSPKFLVKGKLYMKIPFVKKPLNFRIFPFKPKWKRVGERVVDTSAKLVVVCDTVKAWRIKIPKFWAKLIA